MLNPARLGALVALLPALASAPLAQTPIALGESVEAGLTADDLALDDGSYYDLYTFVVESGMTYGLEMWSTDFDTFLSVFYDGEDGEQIDSNDDYLDTTNSRVVFTADRDGSVVVRANALFDGEVGAYEIQLFEGDPLDVGLGDDAEYGDDVEYGEEDYGMGDIELDVSDATSIAVGQAVQGALTVESPRYLDGTHYLAYVFDLDAGETVVLSMQSEAVDAYLLVGAVDADGFFSPLDSDDDSGGDLNAELAFTAPEAGRYAVLANTIGESTGPFTLTIGH